MERLFWICVGGAFGSGARYLVGLAASKWLGVAFPYGTLTVNVLGSFAIGVLVPVGQASTWMSPTLQFALTTGVVGGFTTYSTFSYETTRFMHEGAWATAALYLGLTTALCLAMTFLGFAAARAWLS